jgi:hypothetical protein
MVSIKIDDNLFAHAKYSTDFQESKYINWNRNLITGNEDIAVYTDASLIRVNKNVKKKIGWLLESPAVSAHQHEWIKTNYQLFDAVFTNNKDLLDLSEKFQFVPTCGCWIKPEDQKIWNKSKIVSIIASAKNSTDGHQVRQSIVRNMKGIDIYGRGFNAIPYKLEGLKDYMFSIVVENTKKDYYFTEKLIDCFVTGTIPIYWGCPSIGKFFDDRGIINFNNLEEIELIIGGLSKDLYNNKMEYIKNNFEAAKEYLIAEDYMYEKYLKNI